MLLVIIQCENCDSKYRVDLKEIGDEGRFVRCSHCGHEWVLYKQDMHDEYFSDGINSTEKAEYPDSYLASSVVEEAFSKKMPSNAKFYLSSFFIIISFLANIFLGSIIIEDSNYCESIQRAMGLDSGGNLKISDISIKMFPSKVKNSQELSLNFVIHNDGDTNEKASNLRITAFDKDRKKIAELVSPSSYIINAKETRSIYSLIKDVPLDTRYISIEFSNHLDMILRPSTSLINGKIL